MPLPVNTEPQAEADRVTVLLNLLEVEIDRVVLRDPGSDMARNVATLATRLLRRSLIDRTVVPHLHDRAMIEYRALLPQLQHALVGDLNSRLGGLLDGGAYSDWSALERLLNEVGPALLDKGDPTSSRLAGQLLAIDAGIRADKEKACSERNKARTEYEVAPVGLTDEQQSRLLTFLKQRFPDEVALRIAGVKQIPGGFSKLTMFIELAGNANLPDALVLRWDGPYESSGTSVKMEFPVIETMYAHGVAVPRPFASEPSGSVLDRPFILLGKSPGSTTGDFVVVNQPSRAVALDLARQLAIIHAIPVTEIEPFLPSCMATPRERFSTMLTQLAAVWSSLDRPDGFPVTTAFSWMKANLHLADGPWSIVHRDMGPHNYLVEDDRISAILDWEMVDIGIALEDVGALYYSVGQMIEWEEFIKVYEQLLGQGIDRKQLDFYVVWAAARMATLVSAFTDPVFRGLRESLSEYYLGDYIGQILIERVASKMAEILSPVLK